MALLGGGGVSKSGARAQTAFEPLGESALFQAMLSRPTDLDATLRYAASTARANDVEASIGALERVLFFNPNLSRARFELGGLYFRLGSYEMARGYFQAVQASSDAPEDMKQRAQEFLDAIDKKLQPDQVSGFAQTGLRYQSNASLGPSPQSLLGATRPVNSQFFAKPDWNWFGVVGLSYVHDFGNQNGDVFEANLLAYDAQQFRATEVDAGFVDIRLGPRFGVLQEVLKGASIKPYAVATGALLADAPYLGSAGGGLTMHLNLADVGFDPFVEVRQSGYHDSSLYPLASGLDGALISVGLPAAGQIVEGLQWRSRFAFNHSDTAFAWYSFDRYALDVSFPASVPSPWGGGNWTLTPSFGAGEWLYRQPDPASNPFITERDIEWTAGVGVDIPIKDRFGLGLQVQYRALISNIPGNTVRDLSVTLGPTVSF